MTSGTMGLTSWNYDHDSWELKSSKGASPQHGHPIIADDIRELPELDARAATGGADMAVEHCFEVVPPLVALYPLDGTSTAS